jgi:hypothetical protein
MILNNIQLKIFRNLLEIFVLAEDLRFQICSLLYEYYNNKRTFRFWIEEE